MDFNNRRVQDINQVFDRNWNVNRNNQERREFLDYRKEHFRKMYNIKDKTDQRAEILRANSVDGQIEALNSRMQAMNSGEKINRISNIKNNFR